jgi:urate oxidase
MTTSFEISYGKASVPVYRAFATPLRGVRAIPESAFVERSNALLACEVDVEVFGDNFLPSYTRGDNSMVVATDSMKNLVLREAATFEGATLEALLDFLGRRFLDTYEQMGSLRTRGRELPFEQRSAVLYARAHGDRGTAWLDLVRGADGAVELGAHGCARTGIELLKLTGSAFTRFVRDDYTTLPERGDRPLFVHLDVDWRYADAADATGADASRYVPSEQVRDLCASVFDGFVSESIQHLVHEMGVRMLERFDQLAEVGFSAQNRTRDPFAASPDDPRRAVYSDPFSAYGTITLRLRR